MRIKNLRIKSILKAILFYSISVLLISCASHYGFLSTNAVLMDKNFRIVGLGVGESQTMKILGFGGLKKEALVFDAKKDLYRNVELKTGQALTNITVDFKHEYYFVYSKLKVTVTGEIVDFNSITENTKNYYGLQERNGYRVGEQVFVKINGKYTKRKIERLDFKELQIESSITELQTKEPTIVRYEDSFLLTGYFDYKKTKYSIGDRIEISTKSVNNPQGNQKTRVFAGNAIGISTKYALILDDVNNLYKVIEIDKK